MKFVQEFEVAQDVTTLWSFFEKPEQVARCMPGVESIETLDADTFRVVAKQSVGPISATFESKVAITERVEGRSIGFTATGSAVRGAIGNFRSESVVRLHPESGSTRISVESEAALAGVLGSVGQKVIARQAEKIAAEFAGNLQAWLSGEALDAEAVELPGRAPRHAPATAVAPRGSAAGSPAAPASAVQVVSDGWGKVAAALAAVNVALSLVILSALL